MNQDTCLDSMSTQGKTQLNIVGLNATLDPYCTVTMKTVMGLLESTKMLDQHRTIFFDNYFSSPKLCEELLCHDSYLHAAQYGHVARVCPKL